MYSTVHLIPVHLCFGLFGKIAKKRLFASPCLSVRMEQLSSHWTNFHEIWYVGAFQNTVEKIQVLLQSDKNNVHLT